MITSVVVLPVALLDLIVFSNRFAGPILNFRKRFDKLAKNGVVEELRFRPGDYYPELQDNFNRVCEQLAHQDPSADANSDPEQRVPQVTS